MSTYVLGTGTSPKLKIPKIRDLVYTWECEATFPHRKTMRIWTVRIESFIFCRRTSLNSQNSIRKKFEQVGEIPEISILHHRGIIMWMAKKILRIRAFWPNVITFFQVVSPLHRAMNIFSRCLFWLKVDRTHSNPRTRGRNVGTLRKRAFGATTPFVIIMGPMACLARDPIRRTRWKYSEWGTR